MKTKSKNFGKRRSLYLLFGLFNQIRESIVTKNTTKIYFILFVSVLILPMTVQTYFSTNNQCCADLVLYIIYLRIIYSLLKKKIIMKLVILSTRNIDIELIVMNIAMGRETIQNGTTIQHIFNESAELQGWF